MTIDRKGALAAPTQRVCVGPIASHIDCFAKFLADEGYARNTVTSKCLLVSGSQPLAQAAQICRSHNWTRGSSNNFTPSIATRLGAAMCGPGSSCSSCLRGLGVIAALPQKNRQDRFGSAHARL